MPGLGAPPGAAAAGAPTPRSLAARLVGESGWPTLYGKTDPCTDHPIQNGPPANGLRTREPLSLRRVAVDGRRVYVEAKMVEDPSPRGGDSRVDANTNWASPVLPSPCSSDARKGAYPSGYRREPSSDWAAWISGARLFLLPCQAGCLSVTGGALGSLRAWPPPRERGHVAHRSRVAVLPRAALTGLITLGVGPRLALG